MIKINNKNIKKELKKKNVLIVSIVLLFLAIILFFIGTYNITENEKKAVYLNDIIEKDDNDIDRSAYLNVAYNPYSFAKYEGENDRAFYIVSDSQYFYIVYMDDNLYKELNKDDIKDNHVKIYGVTKDIDSGIKELALDSYNEGLDDEDKITMDDFNTMFGNVYLDTTISNDLGGLFYAIGFVLIFIAIIFLITYIIIKIRINKKLKNIDEEEWIKIEKEIEKEDSIYYKKAHLILTKHYIVSFSLGLDIYSYQDIIWIYEKKLRQYGITTMKAIIVVDTNKKAHTLVEMQGFTKSSKLTIEEIMQNISSKNNKILIGYTSENRKLVKEYTN